MDSGHLTRQIYVFNFNSFYKWICLIRGLPCFSIDRNAMSRNCFVPSTILSIVGELWMDYYHFSDGSYGQSQQSSYGSSGGGGGYGQSDSSYGSSSYGGEWSFDTISFFLLKWLYV